MSTSVDVDALAHAAHKATERYAEKVMLGGSITSECRFAHDAIDALAAAARQAPAQRPVDEREAFEAHMRKDYADTDLPVIAWCSHRGKFLRLTPSAVSCYALVSQIDARDAMDVLNRKLTEAVEQCRRALIENKELKARISMSALEWKEDKHV